MNLVTHLPTTDGVHDIMYTVVNRLSKFTYFILCKQKVSKKLVPTKLVPT